eukprot:c9847_g1_i1.p1 GENE.c9847_g1_i1~~c9847_g1_i1.p1  ORF type:complete len:321 (-),score=97.30 c9847_g1_i1:466-1428(-)
MDELKNTQKLRDKANADEPVVIPEGLMEPHVVTPPQKPQPTESTNSKTVKDSDDTKSDTKSDTPSRNDMPLDAGFDYFPEPTKRRHVIRATHDAWQLSDLVWDMKDGPQAAQPSGASPVKSFMEGITTLIQQGKPVVGAISNILTSSITRVDPLISAFTGSTSMLQLELQSQIPTLSGHRNSAYHTPSGLIWDNTAVPQGFVLDVPEGFQDLSISGEFVIVGDKALREEPVTFEWSLLLKENDDVEKLTTGSFDVEKGSVTLVRQGEYYRKMNSNRIQLAVGSGKIDVRECGNKQVMLWVKPSSPTQVEVRDELVYSFTQ